VSPDQLIVLIIVFVFVGVVLPLIALFIVASYGDQIPGRRRRR
jgi:hypothetical protein